ncbi:Gfo/Idh/MocA family oxidoreductase [Rhodobacteraceae bacterium N5(2021)]|uniref:Gfo/Idh/MocA family oxidoreductase n=1 Tax=Gymnodinialimonas phycosphaerae TaxID=2841589 RepID=A0A975TUU9_9RHOB|nr:Gfo/Idh/MocA family oxidoreductase [Gymnodinialimonas phycosphaerae]MBY4891327.1 Gfo/Idh/MocA family oxidoreductase [Gymnodinialimonas phycosphaerae]
MSDTKDAADSDTYALKAADLPEIAAPDVAYRPPMPKTYQPRIGMIGTGGISGSHLDAYRDAGWEVAALWNRTRDKAEAKAVEYCPAARIEDEWQAILANPDIDVVDITLHPEHRTEIIKAALKAGKHVLSQKPFVTDLDTGIDLVKLAQDQDVKLAVNQNGRWAPHFAFMREAARAGHIGHVLSVHLAIHWTHGWTAGTPFDEIEDLILYDFGVHWFDFVNSLVGDRAEAVFASAARAQGQANKVPLLAQAMVRVDGGQASLVFDGGIPHGPRDTTFVGGTAGSMVSDGPDLSQQTVTLTTPEGVAHPKLAGQWFNDGFKGTMGELLCAIEEDREPSNGAAENLRSLAMAFAAVRSRMTGREVEIGGARRLES